MTFPSIEFILFAFIFFLMWPIMNKFNVRRWLFITSMSFVFYGWWDWRFLGLIIFSGLLDYFCGFIMFQKSGLARRVFLTLSLIGNLGGLAFFKYSGFIAEVLDDALAIFGLSPYFSDAVPEFSLILPVGISFYTFQSMSYTIDIYRGRLNPVKNVLHFFSYLAMFPQLVAGPIIRARDFLGQLQQKRATSEASKWHAFQLIIFGFFRKTVIADNLSVLVDTAFSGRTAFDGSLFWWIVMIAFSFQIYCDFSGYSLIARGIAKYMGYHFKMNFNHPYISHSFKEFWSRWHISLSTWFRDYVYIPLGGSKKSVVNNQIALWSTMLLSGLWHGANYTFLLWGSFHAFFLWLERTTRWPLFLNKMIKNFSVIPLFLLTCISWVFFRSESVDQSFKVLHKMFSWQDTPVEFYDRFFDPLVFLSVALGIEFFFLLKPSKIIRKRSFWKTALVLSACLFLILFFRGPEKQFIYFQF